MFDENICKVCRYKCGVCPAPGSCAGTEHEKEMKEFLDAQEKEKWEDQN